MIEKVSCFPNEGTPQIISGSPVDGDLVRITTGATVIYQRFTSQQAAPGPQPFTLNRDAFRKHIRTALGGNGGAKTTLQEYIDTAKANVGTTAADKKMRSALSDYQDLASFTKVEATDILDDLGFSGAHKSAILNSWPTA